MNAYMYTHGSQASQADVYSITISIICGRALFARLI